MQKYTDEQIKDIQERIEKANAMLKELELFPSASVSSENLGDDVFGTKVIAYLQDSKFTAIPSPLNNESAEKTG